METVELRVHGVHGTSPAAMLGVADGEVGQVAGDSLTGIYRTKDGTLPYRDLADTSVSVEAYSWGALTSGVQGFLGWLKRALWLVLLPFALVNLAYWARIGLATGTSQSRWGARAVRLSGLLLTLFFVITPCVVAIDMGAWQCFRYGVPGCAPLPDWLDFLGSWGPARRIALATLVPMATIGVLWLLSKTSIKRYESVGRDLWTEDARGWTGPVLRHPHLWDGSERTLRLQRFHLSAAVATVIAFTGIHVLVAGSGHLAAWSATGLVLTLAAATAIGAVAVLAVCGNHPQDVEWGDDQGNPVGRLDRLSARMTPALDGALPRVAIGVYVLHVLVLVLLQSGQDHRLDESLDYVGRNTWFVGLFVLLTVLHLSVFTGGRMKGRTATLIALSPLALAVLVQVLRLTGHYDADTAWVIWLMALVAVVFWAALARWHYRHSPDEHADKAWRGAGASVMLATAAWIALLFTSSLVVASANWLNGSDHGVGDLVSKVELDKGDETAPTAIDLDTQRTRSFVATGDVTLRRARVTVTGGQAVVTSGTIEMTGLSLKVDRAYSSANPFTEGRGRTTVDRTATLTVAKGSLTLADSCLSTGRLTCTAEDGRFHPAGVLTVPGSGAVVLSLSKGVVLNPSDAPQVPLAVPQVLIWTTIGQLVWVLAVAIALGLCLRRFGTYVGKAIEQHYTDEASWREDIPARDRDRCVPARRTAALAHRAETLLDVIGAITAPIALVVIVTSLSGIPPWDLPGAGWTRNVATAAMWLVVGMSAGLVALGSQIRRSEKTRKAVGVIWDLTTFWPRAAHPLAPPCYAERVVPELIVRSHWALARPATGDADRQLLLSGHSQGSLIVLSTVSRLEADHLPRVRVITYGSQIRALYGRIFPRVFGADAVGYRPTTGTPKLSEPFPDLPPTGTPPGLADPAVGSARERLTTAGGEWVNLFRRTDPLGWRVFSDVDSDLDLPVPEVPAPGIGDPGPQVMTHSGYQHSAVYRRVVRRWTREPFVPDAAGTQHLPTLPPL